MRSRNTRFTLFSLSTNDEIFDEVYEKVSAEREKEDRGVIIKEVRSLVKRLPELGLVVPVDSTPLSRHYEVSCTQDKLYMYTALHIIS